MNILVQATIRKEQASATLRKTRTWTFVRSCWMLGSLSEAGPRILISISMTRLGGKSLQKYQYCGLESGYAIKRPVSLHPQMLTVRAPHCLNDTCNESIGRRSTPLVSIQSTSALRRQTCPLSQSRLDRQEVCKPWSQKCCDTPGKCLDPSGCMHLREQASV